MNREVNKGVELNRQTVCCRSLRCCRRRRKRQDYFLTFLADELSVEKTDILDFELTVYCKENPEFIGLNDDFISSPRLDNLTSCAALISGLIDARRMEGINLIALFDHEEIGSHTKQGAGSILLHDMLRRILKELGREADGGAGSLPQHAAIRGCGARHPSEPGRKNGSHQQARARKGILYQGGEFAVLCDRLRGDCHHPADL